MNGKHLSYCKNPAKWTVFDTGKHARTEFGGEALYKVCYGEFDDYPEGVTDMEILMRESVYAKVMLGQYRVSDESKYKHTLILLDKNGAEVLPLEQGFCY